MRGDKRVPPSIVHRIWMIIRKEEYINSYYSYETIDERDYSRDVLWLARVPGISYSTSLMNLLIHAIMIS